tara:strand:+ start:14 stop:421 length:408 start_codon:yes stop_codon:yes gene_type:complete
VRKLLILFLLFCNGAWSSYETEKTTEHHDGHLFERFVDGKKLKLDSERFDKFVAGLSDCRIAIVSVKGMVCDFCARGIEKSFKRDPSVIDLDVDLNKGKIFIAFHRGTQVDFENIKEKILANGQNAIDLKIIDIR